MSKTRCPCSFFLQLKHYTIPQGVLNIDLKILFDMPLKLCGWHDKSKSDTGTELKKKKDQFTLGNRAPVFRKCCVNCVGGMLEGRMSMSNA